MEGFLNMSLGGEVKVTKNDNLEKVFEKLPNFNCNSTFNHIPVYFVNSINEVKRVMKKRNFKRISSLLN